MVAPRITCLVGTRALVGESPVWDEAEGALWWTDIKGRVVHRQDHRTGADRAFPMPIRVGCLVLRAGGGFILAAEHGFWAWWPHEDRLEHVLDVEADRPHNRMNDGACDRQGRFVAASMSLEESRQPTGACWRLDASLRVENLADGLRVGNGVAFSPAGDILYLADTMANAVWRHEYLADGAVGDRHPFLDTPNLAGRPDGATVDAEGFYWLAGVYGGQIYRFAPDGRLDRTVGLPIRTPTCLRFGGPRLETLYVTSMGENQPAPAGGLFAVEDLGVRGVAETPFAG